MQNSQPDRLLAMLNVIGAQNQFLTQPGNHSITYILIQSTIFVGQAYNLFANRDFQNGLNASTSGLGTSSLGSSFLPYTLNGLNAKCQSNLMTAANNNNDQQLSSAEKFLLDSPLNLSRAT